MPCFYLTPVDILQGYRYPGLRIGGATRLLEEIWFTFGEPNSIEMYCLIERCVDENI